MISAATPLVAASVRPSRKYARFVVCSIGTPRGRSLPPGFRSHKMISRSTPPRARYRLSGEKATAQACPLDSRNRPLLPVVGPLSQCHLLTRVGYRNQLVIGRKRERIGCRVRRRRVISCSQCSYLILVQDRPTVARLRPPATVRRACYRLARTSNVQFRLFFCRSGRRDPEDGRDKNVQIALVKSAWLNRHLSGYTRCVSFSRWTEQWPLQRKL